METYTEKVLWIQLCPLGYLGLLKVRALVTKSCWMLCNPVDCSSPGSSDHGKNTGVGCHFLLQGIFLTQGSNPISHFVGRLFTIWTTRGGTRSASWIPPRCLFFRISMGKKHLNVWSCYVIWRVSTFIKTMVSQIRAFDLPFSSQPEDGVLKLVLVLYCDTCVTMRHKTPTVFGQVGIQ